MCALQACHPNSANKPTTVEIRTGADQMKAYLPVLAGKAIALVANQTSEIDGRHLVDTLLDYAGEYGFSIKQVFAPEHGFRGVIDDGQWVDNSIDPETGIPIISVYGKYKKPQPSVMEGVDMVVYDIQDVGTRFYTFISTMHYMMEACAEQGIPMLILDRPNPNGNYVDGPVLEPEFSSFVGVHPIPVVHGLTVGELAQMINGERWLTNGVQAEITVIPCEHYTHDSAYVLPVKPSPNLPTQHAIRLYPSTCYFEGTVVSEGRGTQHPFEVFGHPNLPYEFLFTPAPIEGMETRPKLNGQLCRGKDLRDVMPEEGWTRLYLNWLIDAYQDFPDQQNFFTDFFDLLAGTDQMRNQIEAGLTEDEIRASWEGELSAYRKMREKYLLYP